MSFRERERENFTNPSFGINKKGWKTMNEQKYKRTGKNLNKLSFLTSLGLIFFVIIGCSMEPSGIDSIEVSKDKEGKQTTKTFNPGDTVHVKVTPGTFIGKAKIKSYMTAGEDFDDIKKDEKVSKTEQVLEIKDDEFATFSIELFEDHPGGKVNIVAELINDEGKKLDTKTVELKISTKSEGVIPYAPPTHP
jgi:hypothetical protein